MAMFVEVIVDEVGWSAVKNESKRFMLANLKSEPYASMVSNRVGKRSIRFRFLMSKHEISF